MDYKVLSKVTNAVIAKVKQFSQFVDRSTNIKSGMFKALEMRQYEGKTQKGDETSFVSIKYDTPAGTRWIITPPSILERFIDKASFSFYGEVKLGVLTFHGMKEVKA